MLNTSHKSGFFAGCIFLFLLSACGRDRTDNAALETQDKENQIIAYTEEIDTPISTLEEIQEMKFVPLQKRKRFGVTSDILPIIPPLVNLGMLAWDVIKSNKPSISTSNQYANALPSNAKSAMDLVGFSDLQTKSYRIYGTNPYGATVYDVTYTLVHRYGGQMDGKGKYLENVTLIPSHVQVLWGYTFNMDVKASNPINSGSKENPVAELSLEMKYTVSTLIKSIEKHELFVFRGDSETASKLNATKSQVAKN